MPDDKTEEVAEQLDDANLQEAVDAFDEDDAPDDDEFNDGGEESKEDTDKEKSEDDDAGEPDAEVEDKGEEKKDDPEPSAKDRAEQKADENLVGLLDGEPAEVESKPVKKEPAAPKKAAPIRISKESLAKSLSLFSEEEFPEGEIDVNGQKINLADFKAEYPDEFNTAVVIASEIATKKLEEMKASGEFADKGALNELTGVMTADLDRTMSSKAFGSWAKFALPKENVKDLRKMSMANRAEVVRLYRDNEEFINEVSSVHADVRAVRASKKFGAWLKDQPKKIVALASGNDIDSAISLLDFYKEDIAMEKTKAFDKKAGKKKDRHDAIHSGTTRSKKRVSKSSDVDVNDAEAAFDEDDDDE